MPALVTVSWPDGTRTVGRTATELLARLGEVQWQPCDVPGMKQRLSDRAWAWDGSLLDPLLPDDAFLAALGASTMADVEWSP